jgi:predicted nuclease with TOPRIM domain
MPNEKSIIEHIDALVSEERELRDRRVHELTEVDGERQRLKAIEVELDQCWDLLRQRRALREFGQDPDAAEVRPAKVVEDYRG